VGINLGDTWDETKNPPVKNGGQVADMAGVVSRINSALSAAGFTGITASIDQDNNRLQIIDGGRTHNVSIVEGSDTTAADLGLPTNISSSMLFGNRLVAGLQSTMVRGLTSLSNASNDGMVNFKLHDDTTFSVAVDTTGSVQDMLESI